MVVEVVGEKDFLGRECEDRILRDVIMWRKRIF